MYVCGVYTYMCVYLHVTTIIKEKSEFESERSQKDVEGRRVGGYDTNIVFICEFKKNLAKMFIFPGAIKRYFREETRNWALNGE